jgi:predicted DNA-binding transcriptional regulator YafY
MNRRSVERLNRINRLIRIKATGPPKEFAGRLGISERTLYETLELMKSLGAPIKYSRFRESYHYEEDGEFCIRFLRKFE